MYGTYIALMKEGWTMPDIDQMDMLGYWRIKAWASKQDGNSGPVFIDDV